MSENCDSFACLNWQFLHCIQTYISEFENNDMDWKWLITDKLLTKAINVIMLCLKA
jgi:hypothetical protein